MQNGPSYNSSAAMKPEQSERAQSRCSVQFRRAAFFPPGLDPIRDRGRRDEHAVVTPEGPTGGAVGQAVLDDQANGRVAHPAGVVTTGCGEVGGVGVEVLAAAGTVMLGSEDDEIAGPAGERVAEVVESLADEPVAVGTLATTRARPPAVVAAVDTDVGLGQVVAAGDPLSGVGSVFTGSWHGDAPGRRVLPGNTLCGGILFTDSARFPC